MPKSPPSIAKPRHERIASRVSRPALSVLAIGISLIGLACPESTLASEPATTRNREPHPPGGLRETGIAYVDLSSRLRARLESNYSEDPTFSDRLARLHVRSNGPGRRSRASIENRISVTRSLSDRIEVGVVWGMRSSLTDVALFDIDRHTFEAMIRIVP